MKQFLMGAIAMAALVAAAPTIASAVCGDGILESNEECDPGGQRYCNGDPALSTCTTGAQCAGGVNCFYATTCCKFNCQYVGSGATCSDGNQCTGADTCNNVGACIGTAVANGTSCNDGVLCTINDVCTSGVCSGTPDVPAECDDGNPCTDDGCDFEGGCTHTPNTAPCDDGKLCTIGDVCSAGTCSGTPGVPLACNDGNDCTVDSCNAAANGGAGACVHEVRTGSCDDGQFCTQDDTCTSGECAGTPYIPPSCDDGNLCTTDSCNPSAAGGAGACTNTPNSNPCNDELFCTVNDTCTGGTCVGAPRTCDDSNSCTSDSCDEEGSTCVHDVTGAIGEPCDDGSICTFATTCNAEGACSGGDEIDCDDSIPCTSDTCHPITGCRSIPDQEGRDCLDSCEDGIDNDGDGRIDFEDPNCATLAAVQRFAVISTKERGRKALYVGGDVSVSRVSADGICNSDTSTCECSADGPTNCVSLGLGCASDVDCRTAVAGTCQQDINMCACPPAYPNCQADGRPCNVDEDCDVAPFPLGASQAGVCAYSTEVRAGTQMGFLTAMGSVKFGKGTTLERKLEMAHELATGGGAISVQRTSAPLVGPKVCSSALDLACEEDSECPPAVEVCTRGRCTGHEESCSTNADCAPACDARRRVDDGFCIGAPDVACIHDDQCAAFGGDCLHPFVTTDGSTENFQLCAAVASLSAAPPPDVSAILGDISDAITDYVPGPGELVDVAASCVVCPTPETADGDPSCIPCPDPTEISMRKDFRKTVITIGGGLQFLDLRRVRLAGNTALRLNGQDDTVLVVRVARNLRLGGEAQVTVGSNGTDNGSLRVENVLWNVGGRLGGKPNFIRQCVFQGTVLAPGRAGARLGSRVRLDGALFSKKVQISGPSTIVHVPFTGYVPTGP